MLRLSGIEEIIAEGGDFTIFAPRDSAFRRLPEEELNDLLRGTDRFAVRNLVLLHVVPGLIAAGGRTPEAGSGRTHLSLMCLPLDSESSLIGEHNIVAANGLIHSIGTVLVPVRSIAKKSKNQNGSKPRNMRILSLLINEDVVKAEREFDRATSDNIDQLCREYIAVLDAYRSQLLDLRNIPEINYNENSALGRELISQSRTAVKAAIEVTVTAHYFVEALLESFTVISGWAAVETLNRLFYDGSTEWELRSGHIVSRRAEPDASIPIAEGVEVAGRLRREAYVANGITFIDQGRYATDRPA
jgi:hypothetical protein